LDNSPATPVSNGVAGIGQIQRDFVHVPGFNEPPQTITRPVSGYRLRFLYEFLKQAQFLVG